MSYRRRYTCSIKAPTELERYMSRRKAYVCRRERFGAGISYLIMTAFDAARLAEHEKRVADAAEAFWQVEHARLYEWLGY